MTEQHATTDLDSWRDLVLSKDREEFVDSVRRHLSARCGLAAVRASFDGDLKTDENWAEIADAEYPMIGVPESAGGMGTMADTVALLEASGRELLPAPLLATVMALQTKLVSGLPLGDVALRPAALAHTPAAHGAGAASVLRLDKIAVLDGLAAEQLVLVQAAGSKTLIAEVDLREVSASAIHSHIDPSRPLAVFDLAEPASVTEVHLDVDTVLGPARVAIAADLTGIAAGALDRAVQYATEREQFGKTIGSFQGIKHRLADVYVGVERARSLTRAAAVLGTNQSWDSVDVRELTLLAKAAATEAAVDSSRAYVQILGAMGMTFEADAHLFFRRAQQTAPVLGGATECYRQAAQLRRSEYLSRSQGSGHDE